MGLSSQALLHGEGFINIFPILIESFIIRENSLVLCNYPRIYTIWGIFSIILGRDYGSKVFVKVDTFRFVRGSAYGVSP